MALIRSSLISAASGSIGGLTFLHSAGGMAIRARAVPVNPSTPLQNVVRTLLAFLNSQWIEVLTRVQRAGWDRYANAVPLPGRLGNRRTVTGLAHWIRSQLPRLQAGLSILPNAPNVLDLGAFTPIALTGISSMFQIIQLAFNVNDPWTRSLGAAMLLYVGKPQNPTVQTFRAGYRYADRIDGHPFFPPASPVTLTLPFTVYSGQRLFFRVVVTAGDGRYSGTRCARGTVS